MIKKEDARVLRTKHRLITTFHALLKEKSYENITVNEICDRSSVRRATFYKHFQDKTDFVGYFVTVLREQFDLRTWKKKKPGASSDYYVEYLRGIVRFLTENELIVMRLLESSALSSVVDIVTRQNYIDTLDRLEKSVYDGMALPATPPTVASFMTGGVSHAIIGWFKDGKPIPEEQFIKEVAAVIRALQSSEK